MGSPMIEFHHHIRRSSLCGATIKQPRDIAVIKRGENLPLGPEAPFSEAAAHVRPHELDGDFGFVLIVGAHRSKDVSPCRQCRGRRRSGTHRCARRCGCVWRSKPRRPANGIQG